MTEEVQEEVAESTEEFSQIDEFINDNVANEGTDNDVDVKTDDVEDVAIPAAEAKEEVPEKEDTDNTDKLHAAFEELNRRELEVRSREKDLKETSKNVQSYEDMQKLAQDDPLKFLKDIGTSYQEVTNKIIDSDEPDSSTPENEILKELKLQVDQLLKEKEESKLESTIKTQQQEVETYMAEVGVHVKENDEDFELCSINWDAAKDIYLSIQSQYANRMLQSTGEAKMLPMEDVLENVEKYFENQLDIFSKAKKFTGRTSLQNEDTPSLTPIAKKNSKTITNKQSRSLQQPSRDELLTDEDRLELAVKVLKGQRTA